MIFPEPLYEAIGYTALGGAAVQTGASAKFCEADLHGLAVLTLTRRFRLRQRLRLVWRACGAEAIFDKTIRGTGPAEAGLARVLLSFTQGNIARREIRIDLVNRAARRGRGWSRGNGVFRDHNRLEREKRLHGRI